MPQKSNQSTSQPTLQPTNKHAEIVVGWYQQQLADAQLQIANLVAVNQTLTSRVQELTTVDPNSPTAKGSDA